MHVARYNRYVAIGDSSTEGLNDVDGSGGYRGWSRRLAAKIADAQGELEYVNLGERGLTTREIRVRQLDVALSLSPDLVTLFSGTNDVLSRRFDASSVESDMLFMQRAFIARGATVLTFTLPDLTPIMPIARFVAPRIRAMNVAVRSAARASGATVVDFARYPVATDLRLWHEDRIHANATGHGRIADALAQALGLPGTDDSWGRDLPGRGSPSALGRVARELYWGARYLIPWALRGIRNALMAPRSTPGAAVVERYEGDAP